MLSVLPLPFTWLVMYVAGRASKVYSAAARRYTLAVLSLVFLLLFCGTKTWCLYITAGAGAILASYLVASIRWQMGRKIVFIASIVALVLMIVVFLKWRIYIQKYFVCVPSLSYLGFRAISCVVTAYKRRRMELSGGLMQMFFAPILVMGPISRVEDFEEVRWDYQDVLHRLLLGFSMLIGAHFLGGFILAEGNSFAGLPCSAFWIGMLANAFELYFVFSGYSHLIIGLGLLVGFKLPENFNNPYMSTSISEFWRRWHMSLSFWLRDYLYLPLGGNRKGISRKCINMMLTMGLCGAWHGLSMHYLAWGLFHGGLLAIESIMAHYEWSPLRVLPAKVYRPVKILLIFSLVAFAWILFRYSLPDVLAYLKGMVAW